MRSNQNMLLLLESFSKNNLKLPWTILTIYLRIEMKIENKSQCLFFLFLWLFFLHTFPSNEDKHWKSIMFFHCDCSVPKSCLTLWDPINCSMPGFSVLHYLSEFTQIHAYCVNDTIPLSHPLSPLITHTNMFAALWHNVTYTSRQL